MSGRCCGREIRGCPLHMRSRPGWSADKGRRSIRATGLPRRARLFHLDQLEPHIALELVGGFLAGMRIVLALAGLAQMARHQEAAHASVQILLAALLDENAGDGRLAGLGGKVVALPALAAKPRIEE